MAGQTSEFQGILTLNLNLVDQLYRYLEDREEKTCQQILAIFQEPSTGIKFSETVDLIGKKIRQANQTRQNLTGRGDWREICRKISDILWKYLEILEGSVTELFQQLDQIGVEEWGMELAHSVDAIKELLLHRLDDLSWTIRRLEHLLYDYRWAAELRASALAILKKGALFWQNVLDRALKTNLEKCRKYLGFRYQKFSDQYERYIDIHTAIELVVDKFSECRAFSSLDIETQDKFKKLYRLVRLWQLNRQARALPRRETIRAVRNAMSPERAVSLFKEYDKQLRRTLFAKSLMIKELPEETKDRGSMSRMQEEITGYRVELGTLMSTLSTYRDFLLKSDPGLRAKPQVGFSEWAMGPESHETKQLTVVGEDLRRLDEMMASFGHALEMKGTAPDSTIADVDQEVQAVLHEMAQPLISRQTMHMRAERFIGLLQMLDILSSSDQKVVDYVGKSLNKALRADWQYRVLFDIPAFHSLYAIYKGLVNPVEEKGHLHRLQKFKRLIQQLEHWVNSNDTPRHTHEIELDLNDMKGYLQDFLAYAQRLSREDLLDRDHRHAEIAQQLLEYRYLFGNFFHHVQDNSIESRILRKQLLFVDQYFDAVENQL